MKQESLSKQELLFLITLGLPSLGLALSYTLVMTYLPIFIEKLSGPAVTGIIIGGEGIFAFIVPFVIGAFSDALQSVIGKRLPFILIGCGLLLAALVLMPLSSGKLSFIALELAIFFVGYYTYYTAYYAFFPDLVPNEMSGRSQGTQGAFRSLGMLISFIGGGALIEVWEAFPFVVVASLLLVLTILFYFGIRHKIETSTREVSTGELKWSAQWKMLQNDINIRYWFLANSFWETAIACLKVFIVLYFTKGLLFNLYGASAILGLVGIGAIIAAPISGKLADKYGHEPIILIATFIFAIGLLPPLFSTSAHIIVIVIPVAFIAVTLITLPYSVLMRFLPKHEHHGAAAALFSLSQGIGAMIGPLTAGIFVELLKNCHCFALAKTNGYAAIFGVSSFYLFLSIPFAILMFQRRRNV